MNCNKDDIHKKHMNIENLDKEIKKLSKLYNKHKKDLIDSINGSLLKKIKYKETNGKIYNRFILVEKEWNLYNKFITSDDFILKKNYNSDTIKTHEETEYLKKRNEIKDTYKTKKGNLQYIISIYKTVEKSLNLDKENYKLLQTYKKELELKFTKSKKMLLTLIKQYLKLIKDCIKLYKNKKKLYTTKFKKIYNKKKQCCDKIDINHIIHKYSYLEKTMHKLNTDLHKYTNSDIEINNTLQNTCDKLIGGNICKSVDKTIKDLNNVITNKQLIISELKHNINKITHTPKLVIDDIVINDKIAILQKQIKKMKKEKKEHGDKIVSLYTINMDCIDKSNNSDYENSLCTLLENEINEIDRLNNLYSTYFKKYGCISILNPSNPYYKDKKTCKKYIDNIKKIEEKQWKKCIKYTEQKKNKIKIEINKMTNKIKTINTKIYNFQCNKYLAEYSSKIVKELQTIFMNCEC